nr:MAG TPA: hypothetical protein [Caudoviricetes sp.]
MYAKFVIFNFYISILDFCYCFLRRICFNLIVNLSGSWKCY